MPLATKLEKIKFIVDEMQLAMQLAKHAPDDFIARMLARHVIIRANDFITHVRKLKGPLTKAGFSTKDFHSTKETYAKNFDEYFRIARDRLGAHVQDFDFRQRLELWNEIEITKIGFFSDGALEIYKILEFMAIPGLVAYANPVELKNTELNEVLTRYKSSLKNNQGVEIGTDPLAMTRANTSAVLNLSPVHLQAGQLSLVRRWIKAERQLLEELNAYPVTARILKARLVTDIVSFFDCLVTRSVAPTAPQYMEGLNTILIKDGNPSSTIENFLKNFTYERPLQELREIRDHFCAHLDDNDIKPLSALLSDFENLDILEALSFYDIVKQVFEKTCHEFFFLKMHAADGRRMRGVMASVPSVIPFDKNNPPGAPLPPAINIADRSTEAYKRNLGIWLNGDQAAKSDAQHYFWSAFCNSEVVEKIDEREDFGGGSYRNTTHNWRTAAEFILGALNDEPDADAASKILQLLAECRSSDTYLLSEIIIRYSRSGNAKRHEIEICYYLGELASYPHSTVRAHLLECTQRPGNADVQFHAMLALFKIFARSEGLIRINEKRYHYSYDDDAGRLLALMAEKDRLLFSVVFASQFCLPQLGHFSTPLLDEYNALRAAIADLSRGLLPPEFYDPVSDMLKRLQETHDFAGVCFLLADQFKASGDEAFSNQLLRAACFGVVVTTPHDQALRHLACCFLRAKDYAKALELANDLARRNPDDVQAQIFVACILGEAPDAKIKALQKISVIRSQYRLADDENETLLSLERHLTRDA